MNRTMKAAWGSLAVAVLALGLKLGAWWAIGSVALSVDFRRELTQDFH